MKKFVLVSVFLCREYFFKLQTSMSYFLPLLLYIYFKQLLKNEL